MPTGQSIHIGLNHVDPNAFYGWDGALSDCINDARDMQAIADRTGRSSTLLIDSEAVSSRVIGAIGLAAQQLTTGDVLLLTYSGHYSSPGPSRQGSGQLGSLRTPTTARRTAARSMPDSSVSTTAAMPALAHEPP